jgi:predicted S18 family serine protease
MEERKQRRMAGMEINAYQLADKLLSEVNCFDHQCAFDAASMLRQQADRIKDLEKLLEHSIGADCREMRYIQEIENRDARIAELEKQCSEPVAWLWIHNGTTMNALLRNPAYDERSKEHWAKKGWTSKPLYTTPQLKELSDEEIDSLIAEYKIGEFSGFYVDKAMTESMQRRYKNVLDFARAILKKASEK